MAIRMPALLRGALIKRVSLSSEGPPFIRLRKSLMRSARHTKNTIPQIIGFSYPTGSVPSLRVWASEGARAMKYASDMTETASITATETYVQMTYSLQFGSLRSGLFMECNKS